MSSIHGVEAKLLIEELAQDIAPSQWRVLMLYSEGYNPAEVADMLGISRQAVKSLAFRGRERARQLRSTW